MPQIDKTKRIGFRASLALHLFALALTLAIPWACAIREKKKPSEPMKPVQIPISIQAVPAPNSPVVEPPQTVSIPEPVKQPIQKPKAKPAPKPKPVEKQTNRVTKVKAPTNLAKPPEPPTEESIRNILTADIPSGGAVVLEPGESDPALDNYYRLVSSRMHSAWMQPSQYGALPGLSVEVSLVVEPSGKIIERTMICKSGNGRMDDSVMQAVRSVKELPPPPGSFESSHEIVVTFVLGE